MIRILSSRMLGMHIEQLERALWEQRYPATPLRFLRKAIGRHGVLEKITIDKSGANTAAIVSYNANHDAAVEIRQVKYLNNILEQDHRVIKRMSERCWGLRHSGQRR
jgi:transposase-like protein